MEGIMTLSRRVIAIYNRKRFWGITSEVASPLPAKHIAANTIKLHNKDICAWGQPSLAGLQMPHAWHSCHGEPLGGVSVLARRCNILGSYWLQTGLVLTGKFYFCFLKMAFCLPLAPSNCCVGIWWLLHHKPCQNYCSSAHSHFLFIFSMWSPNPLRLTRSAKHTRNSNFTSKTFQQGHSGWLRAELSSHTKCKAEHPSKSNTAAHKVHETHRTLMNAFNVYHHLKWLEIKQYSCHMQIATPCLHNVSR